MSALRVGTSIGRYRVDQLLNSGGMGEVWRGYDHTLGRPVALKLLHAGVSDANDRERFVREARAAAQLSHPHVVAVYDVGEWSGRPYLVMELLDGRTLAAELAERGPLPVVEVRDLGAQAAAGLEAAHRAGVVHRDIKPSNLVRTRDGTLKVVDFGIARVLDEAASRLTRTGTVVGTAAYLAPEQARGVTADARSDLYALGCVLYQLLCSRAPFTGGPTEVVYAHLHTEPDPPSRWRPDIPADLEALVLALMAKDPDERPADAASVRAALLAGPPESAADSAMTAAIATPVVLPAPPSSTGSPGVAGGEDPGDATSFFSLGDRSERGAGEHAKSRQSRKQILMIAGLVTAGLVAVGLLALSTQGWRDTPSTASGDQGRSAAPVSKTNAPTTTPTPTPTPTTPSATPSATTPSAAPIPTFGTAAWLQQVDAALAELAATGAIDSDVADDLRSTISDALSKFDEGKPGQARKKSFEVRRELVKAFQNGDLAQIDPLRDLLGPALNDQGDGGDNGDGDHHDRGRRG
ncbi:protein kinase domain-containing protein [Actinopolymorpha alba]|uniref:protein kinase domain-containing protein n=1 Tax=Actinopolymorpha alba TaxID=533267 RepID=UPI0003A61EFF|nr:protein kinase [Actinopolymorpha alba]